MHLPPASAVAYHRVLLDHFIGRLSVSNIMSLAAGHANMSLCLHGWLDLEFVLLALSASIGCVEAVGTVKQRLFYSLYPWPPLGRLADHIPNISHGSGMCATLVYQPVTRQAQSLQMHCKCI